MRGHRTPCCERERRDPPVIISVFAPYPAHASYGILTPMRHEVINCMGRRRGARPAPSNHP
jgi:hypothetical protein